MVGIRVDSFLILAVLFALLLASSASCQSERGEREAPKAGLEAVPPSRWEALAKKRIFFGHQSVGLNIIEGMRTELQRFPNVKLVIRETSNPEDMEFPIFANWPIGRNTDPQSKIDDFKRIIDDGIGRKADICIFKFCFVDIDHRSDIESLFNYYDQTITALEARYPNLKIVTLTVPLTNMPGGLKSKIKKILGRMPPYLEDDRSRQSFNDKLRTRFGELVFDLAKAESTMPNGTPITGGKAGERIELLYPAYTDDGGHLNELGRRIIASEFLAYLLKIQSR